uniref:Uncharacterized protein n=1 Tax=viral metagenome TaxID=1070528 RepID=A0A6M3JVA2_9ZZZZ
MTQTWFGSPPDLCELCKEPFASVFYDARINHAPPHLRGKWALLCRKCFIATEGRLGLNYGQEYDLQTLKKLRG